MSSKKKLKQQQALEEKLRKEQEALERQNELYRQAKREHFLRLALLRETYKIIDGIGRGLAKISATKEQKKSVRIALLIRVDSILNASFKWDRYISCTKFPFAHQPAELRSFLARWAMDVQNNLANHIDWQLQLDERTMLSQNLAQTNLTDTQLRGQQPNIAQPFAEKAVDAMRVLTDIEDVLERPEHYQCTEKCIAELLEIKDDYRSYLWSTLDILTFATIGNVERDMVSKDARTAAYEFKSSIFSIGLYTDRDVPQPRMLDRADNLSVRFDSIMATIQCPKLITFDESALRGLWFSYDHYSDQAPSYTIPNRIASVTNLMESCRLEAEDKERLEDDRIAKMKRNRAAYEEAMGDGTKPPSKDDDTKPAKKQSKGAKSVKIMEPPKVDDDTVVDVTAEYLEIENRRSIERLDFLHPDEMRLQPDELNLRQYNVLGGTYAIHYVARPLQSRKFDNHLFLCNVEKPAILKYRSYKQPYRPIEFPSDCKLSAIDQEEIKYKNQMRFEELIEITVQLTSDVFWWQEPIVCRWQPWEDSDEFGKLHADLRDYNLNYEKLVATKSSRLWNPLQNHNINSQRDIMEDFDLNGNHHETPLVYLIRKHLLPRLSVTYRFENELKEAEEKLATEVKRRQHLQRELEEDLRLEAEQRFAAKQVKDEERAIRRAKRAARMERFLELKENGERMEADEENFETLSSSSSSSENEMDGGMDENATDSPGGELVPFKNLIEGTAARELFPFLEKCAELEVQRPKRGTFRWSVLAADMSTLPDPEMLSGFLDRIAQYNLEELPKFVEEQSAGGAKKKGQISDKAGVKAAPKKGKRGAKATLESTVMDDEKPELKLIPHAKGKWMTTGIYIQNYNAIERTITFKTSEIGVFGFAENKYHQFPITYWEVKPNSEKPMTTLITVAGSTITIEILVSDGGFHLTITKPTPKKCPITVPTRRMSLAQLIEFLRQHNINLFAEPDAYWYIQAGTINVKHIAMCDHTYRCIGHFCQTHQFRWSAWNALAKRREAIVLCRQVIENRALEQFAEIKITPHDAYFVRVEELCTSLDDVSLFFHMLPPDQEFSCDVFSLLTAQSVDKSKKKQQNTSIRLKSNVSELLTALQLLSYSS